MADENPKTTGGETSASPAGVDIRALLAMSSSLGHRPSGATATAVALQSGQLEDYFRLMRERAQAISRGLTAQDEMKAMTPAVPVEAAGAKEGFAADLMPVNSSFDSFGTPATSGQLTQPTLAQFFETVTQSIVDAQSALDLQSLSYARQLQGTPIAPVHFSIPNVHAEVKMGFNVDDPSNLLVKLFGKPEDTTNYGESTVSFDIAASPPPPGSDFSNPIPMFLAVAPERDRVLATAAIPEAQRAGAVLLKNAAAARLSADSIEYIAIVPHDQMASAYRVARDRPSQPVRLDVRDQDAAKLLADIVAMLNAWLQSVTLPRG